MKILGVILTLVIFAGCAGSRVEFSDSSRIGTENPMAPRTISLTHKMCEVEKQLALYADEKQNLWLNCPYRYNGGIMPQVVYIGPKSYDGQKVFIDKYVEPQIRNMKKLPLRSCGKSEYCADLSELGYYDFSVRMFGGREDIRASVSYKDLSQGITVVNALYEMLGKEGTIPTLDPAYNRFLDVWKVDARLQKLNTLEQLDVASKQIATTYLSDNSLMREKFDSRRKQINIELHRAKNTFEGYEAAYALSMDIIDAERMRNFAKTDAQRGKIYAALIDEYRISRSESALLLAKSFITNETQRAEADILARELNEAKRIEAERQKTIAEKNQIALSFKNSVKSIGELSYWLNRQSNKKLAEEVLLELKSQVLGFSDFGKNLTIGNFFNSIEYKSFLVQESPNISVIKRENYGVRLEYQYFKKVIVLTNPASCKKLRSYSTKRGLGFFESWLPGNKKDYTVNWSEYECQGNKTAFDEFERKLSKSLQGLAPLSEQFSQKWKYANEDSEIANYENTNTSADGPRGGLKDIYRFENGQSIRAECKDGSGHIITRMDTGGWYYKSRVYQSQAAAAVSACQ